MAAIRKFAAQMDAVVGNQITSIMHARSLTALHNSRSALRPGSVREMHFTDTDGIEHRGDAGANHFAVMGNDRGASTGQGAAGSWHDMALDIVGVELDQAGDQKIALADRGRPACAEDLP